MQNVSKWRVLSVIQECSANMHQIWCIISSFRLIVKTMFKMVRQPYAIGEKADFLEVSAPRNNSKITDFLRS